MKKMWIVLLMASLALAGCGPAPTAVPTPIPVSITEETLLPTPADPLLQTMAQTATDDLAQRLSVPKDQIKFIEASSVTWSDGSLGCPKPGVAYIQMLVTGYLVVLESGGTRYEYHADDRGNISYCQSPSKP